MGALERVFRGRRGGQERPAAAIVAGLWRNGEQGVWYDPSDFDRYMGMVGASLTPAVASVFGESVVVSPGVYRIYSTGAFSAVNGISTAAATIGEKYEVRFTVDSITTLGSGLVIESVENPSITTLGPQRLIVTAMNTNMFIKRGAACDIQISGLSVKQWLGRNEVSIFQDAAGTTPVLALEQPVGLMLDKRFGLARSAEKITNGNFSAGAANWATSGTDATHVVTFSGAGLRYQSDTTTPAMYVSQPANMVIGRLYELTFTVSSWTSGTLKSDTFTPANIPIATGVGTFKTLLTAISTGFNFTRGSPNVDMTISSISVREVFGNHASQPTTTSRPTLTARYNACINTEDPSQSNWVKTGIVVTKNYATAPDGTPTAALLTSPAEGGYITCGETRVAAAPVKRLTVHVKNASTGWARVSLAPSSGSGGVAVFVNTVTGASGYILTTGTGYTYSSSKVTVLGDGWLRVQLVVQCPVAHTVRLVLLAAQADSVSIVPAGATIQAWGLDIRPAADSTSLPPYQRVINATTYDSVGFPARLWFDGIDDFFQIASIDFTGTNKIFVGVGAWKTSDAATGLVLELSTGTGSGSPGSFALYASPNSAAQVGAIAYVTGLGYKYAPISAPANYVQVVQFDAGLPAAGQIEQRVNESSAVALSGGDIGAGNFGNYAMFMGRRGAGGSLFAGYISQAIVCGKRVSAPEANAVKKLINSKTRAF